MCDRSRYIFHVLYLLLCSEILCTFTEIEFQKSFLKPRYFWRNVAAQRIDWRQSNKLRLASSLPLPVGFIIGFIMRASF